MNSWKQLLALCLAALAVTIAADVALRRLGPPRQMREVEDGIGDLKGANPDTLVLGSSHARTLHVLGEELARRTQGRQTLVAVPLENGKLVPYQWLLEHRVEPLIDARDGNGQPVKSRLRRVVLITEWWDSCPHPPGSPYWNLPARAWTAADFIADVADHGITGFNRNYLQNRFRHTLGNSSLVYDRTQQVLITRVADLLQGRPLWAKQQDVEGWRRMIEAGEECIGDPEQMAALAAIADDIAGRDLEMTILLFPRKPDTLSELARQTTLREFADMIHGFAGPRGIRVVDLTTTSPMGDEDFMEDFDHINAEGNREFAVWALDHDLGFLQEPVDGRFAGTR